MSENSDPCPAPNRNSETRKFPKNREERNTFYRLSPHMHSFVAQFLFFHPDHPPKENKHNVHYDPNYADILHMTEGIRLPEKLFNAGYRIVVGFEKLDF